MKTIHKICVCGAGTMGSGIAQVCAVAGYETILMDLDAATLERGTSAILKGLEFLVAKKKMTSDEKVKSFNRIVFTTRATDCVADLVIEAIVEKPEIKKSLFRQLSTVNGTGTIFASNTSSLSVNDLQEGIDIPQRFLGMHFFNPAPVMKLVEIVQGKQTDPTVVDTVYDLTKKLGKTPVLCQDSPGFIVNRVARPYYLEAMRLVQQGVATFETVDEILEASGFKMGPFKLMDLIGMDINYSVSNIVWQAMGKPSRLEPSPLQKEKVAANKMGKKTGEGFYTYQ